MSTDDPLVPPFVMIELDHEEYREVRAGVLASMAAWVDKVQVGPTGDPLTAAELLAAFPVGGERCSR